MQRATLLILSFALATDRLLKFLSIKQSLLFPGEISRFGPLSFTHFSNTRLAFSLPLPLPAIIIGSVAIIFFLVWYYFTTYSTKVRFALLCILFGSLSNLFDRMVYGAVIDYFSFWRGGFFNLADILIAYGIFTLIVQKNTTKA